MKIIKSLEDLYPHDVEELVKSHKIAMQLVFDLFMVHQSLINEGFDDYAIFYILECAEDYSEVKKLQPHLWNYMNENECEHNGICYFLKIVNDSCLVIIGRKEFFDEN